MTFLKAIPAAVPAAIGGLLLAASSDAARGQCEANEQVKLTASDAVPDAWFGRGVALSGQVALIGATLGDDGVPGSGSAYAYRWNGNSWIEEAELTASDAGSGGGGALWFGGCVSVDGNVAVIGAMGDSGETGAAYVFRFDGNAWTEEAKLTASNAAAGARFGYHVAISGDLVVAGAYRADVGAQSQAGTAYVYRYDSGTWTEEAKLVATDAASGDQYGWSVSVSGERVLIAAPKDSNEAGTEAGAAYLYRLENAQWIEEAKLSPPTYAPGREFGSSVSLSGEVALVGSGLDDPMGSMSGSAYVHRFDGAQWNVEAYLVGGHTGDQFGAAVSVDGDVAVIGAWADSVAGAGSGSAFVFHYNGAYWEPQAKLTASDGSSNDGFGYPVAVSGSAAVIGAYHDHGGAEIHSAYLFVGLSDCNNNTAMDLCDIADGTSDDENGNGVPDECDAAIPTVSEWGLIIMTALLLAAGMLVMVRRRPAPG